MTIYHSASDRIWSAKRHRNLFHSAVNHSMAHLRRGHPHSPHINRVGKYHSYAQFLTISVIILKGLLYVAFTKTIVITQQEKMNTTLIAKIMLHEVISRNLSQLTIEVQHSHILHLFL